MSKNNLNLKIYFQEARKSSEIEVNAVLLKKIDDSIDQHLGKLKSDTKVTTPKTDLLSILQTILYNFGPNGLGLATGCFFFGIWLGITNPEIQFRTIIYDNTGLDDGYISDFLSERNFFYDILNAED